MGERIELDKRTSQLLGELASSRGHRRRVMREALQFYADMQDRVKQIESDPHFRRMISDSDKAIREGRVTPHSEVVRMSRARSKKRK